MPLYIDQKFVNLLSSRLERFQRKSESLWNFRCPLCGDSKTNKIKARGYVYRVKDALFYRCHNCNTGLSIGNFIKTMDPGLYKEYRAETYIATGENKDYVEKQKNSSVDLLPRLQGTRAESGTNTKHNSIGLDQIWPSYCQRIIDLPANHFARTYVSARKIPRNFLSDLIFTPDFQDTVKFMVPSKSVDAKHHAGEARIIIPFKSSDSRLIGFQGRELKQQDNKYGVKYLTVKLDDSYPKLWGLDRVNLSKTLYVLEGPFDAMFLDNAVATTDSTLFNIRQQLPNIHEAILVYDNQPKNPDIVSAIRKSIARDFKVCIWPKHLVAKDVNDMVLTGLSGSHVQAIIDANSFTGLMAEAKLNEWKGV